MLIVVVVKRLRVGGYIKVPLGMKSHSIKRYCLTAFKFYATVHNGSSITMMNEAIRPLLSGRDSQQEQLSNMRLSPFHMQLASEFAKGKRNKEILANYKINPSRLSVIKANPLFRQEIERQRRLGEDKYGKAVSILENEAESVAKELVSLVKNPAISGEVRSKTAENILNRVAQSTGKATPQLGQELVFEQLLRVTKRTSQHDIDSDAPLSFDPEDAYKDLMADLEPSPQDDEDIIDITPDPVSFTRQLPPDTPIPTTGNNGGDKKFVLSPRLRAILEQNKTH